MARGMGGQQELVKDGYEISIQIFCFVVINLTCEENLAFQLKQDKKIKLLFFKDKITNVQHSYWGPFCK